MGKSSPEMVWQAKKTELLRLIDSEIFQQKPKKITFYAPSFTGYKTPHFRSSLDAFATFSITGEACALDCKHCGRKVLASMIPTITPSGLFDAAKNLKKKGGIGCLVSGGCLSDGSVPLQGFIATMARIKKELDLLVMVHTGITDLCTAKALKKAGIDVGLIDVIGSDRTIRRVCNLDVSVKDYEKSLEALEEVRLNFVPHVIVGLDNGKLDGEFNALKMISGFHPAALVIIAFMPIQGTNMASIKAPKPYDIARVIAVARLFFPKTRLSLGCMRPKGKDRDQTDVLAIKAGVDAIAFPSEKAIVFAEENGYDVSFSAYCCAHIYQQRQEEVRSLSK
ncbi:TPA: radical SAM protein [Candidatus Bathyarchaeota archaeon]|nr:radical SAM protein [Candidatus Bathyarchaeota archaeon]